MTEVMLLAITMVLAPLLLLLVVALFAHRQNQRVVAMRSDRALQAMLDASSFLEGLAQDASVPEALRRRAETLAQDYPRGDQLRVFANRFLGDLRRVSR